MEEAIGNMYSTVSEEHFYHHWPWAMIQKQQSVRWAESMTTVELK